MTITAFRFGISEEDEEDEEAEKKKKKKKNMDEEEKTGFRTVVFFCSPIVPGHDQLARCCGQPTCRATLLRPAAGSLQPVRGQGGAPYKPSPVPSKKRIEAPTLSQHRSDAYNWK